MPRAARGVPTSPDLDERAHDPPNQYINIEPTIYVTKTPKPHQCVMYALLSTLFIQEIPIYALAVYSPDPRFTPKKKPLCFDDKRQYLPAHPAVINES